MPTTPRSAAAPFAVGDAAELLVTDFRTAGMPKVWRPATVVKVTPNDHLFTVAVRCEGIVSAHLVGPRGGGRKLLRAAAVPA